MLPSVVRFFYDYSIALAPFIIWVVIGIFMFFKASKNKLYSNAIVYTSIVAIVGGAAVSAITLTAIDGGFSWKNRAAFFVFYSINLSFTFIPIFLAFLKLEIARRSIHEELSSNNSSSQTTTINRYICINSSLRRYVIYFGFLWSAIAMTAGFSVTILYSSSESDAFAPNTYIHPSAKYGGLFIFLMGWGFIIVTLLLAFVYFKEISQALGRTYFMLYTITTMIFMTTSTVLEFLPVKEYRNHGNAVGYSFIFFVDIPAALAVFFVFYIGSIWAKTDDSETSSH
ncbi:MAG: hypothetical protein EXX96DRAFT_540429 [Benjaminiella poitrasii]|nr:MAG: hypothetical protein EXX96DRAFT_540429 [Benjaminiella poitrasii]